MTPLQVLTKSKTVEYDPDSDTDIIVGSDENRDLGMAVGTQFTAEALAQLVTSMVLRK